MRATPVTTKLLSFAAIVATLAVSACADPAEREDVAPSPLVQPPMMNTRPASFDCNDSGRVVVRPVGDDGRAIVLAFANRELQLKSVAATEGQKYSDGQTVFWMNGTNATLAVSGNDTAESCEKK
jgi:membrane-bound inhibitor of C-type lysozyme